LVNLGKGGRKGAEHAAEGVIKKNADKIFHKADVPGHGGGGGRVPPHGGAHGYPDDPLFAAANRDVDLDRITPPGHVRRTDEDPLVRHDVRHPDEIFEEGLPPLDVSERGDYDLDRHVYPNPPGPFVSTHRANDVPDGVAGQWRYDIDAPGGIDMRRSPGVNDNPGEAEVAFPGGVDRSFIRGAELWGVDEHGMDVPMPGTARENPHYRNWRHR